MFGWGNNRESVTFTHVKEEKEEVLITIPLDEYKALLAVKEKYVLLEKYHQIHAKYLDETVGIILDMERTEE